jgi:hypothetical protein
MSFCPPDESVEVALADINAEPRGRVPHDGTRNYTENDNCRGLYESGQKLAAREKII